MKQNHITRVLWIVSLLVIFLGLSACASKMTPPGANIIFGSLMAPAGFGGSYTLLQWEEGLSISIVDDSQDGHKSSGSGSTEDPVWQGQGSIGSGNGEGIAWRVETPDGKTAQFLINGQPYDLTQGTLFLIKTNGGSPQIMQYQNPYNGRCSDDESCQQLLKQNPAVTQFIQETLQLRDLPSPIEPPEAPTASFPAAPGEEPISAGWLTYTSQQCEYVISYPTEMLVQSQTPYSDLLVFNLADPDDGARNFVYISVITPEVKRMAEQGVYNHDVYNYDQVETEILLKMQVGDSKPVREIANTAPSFTYQRQPNTTISGYSAQTYENLRPWEFPEGTTEIRYYLSIEDCIYLIGGYMDTKGSDQPSAITEDLFHQIVATVQLIP